MPTIHTPVQNQSAIPYFFVIISSTDSFAQKSYQFTSGLALKSGANYGREALYIDPLAHAIYTSTLAVPVEGGKFGNSQSGDLMTWTKVSADTANRFRIRGGANNYLYFQYESVEAKSAILNIAGNSAVFVNGEPHMGDPYAFGWMNIPVKLKKGRNDFFVRGQGIQGGLSFPEKPISIEVKDATSPFIVVGNNAAELKAAVVVINTTAAILKNLQLSSSIAEKRLKVYFQPYQPIPVEKFISSLTEAAYRSKDQMTVY